MTRLTAADLRGIPAELEDYDRELAARTGCSLRALACRAAGLEEGRLAELAREARVAVVPLDAGQGVLPGFAEAVRSVATRLGFPAWVTAAPDAGGLAEAYRGGAGILVTADDAHFIAVNLRTRGVAHNNQATALGFVTVLELLAGGLADREALVLGCGPVGREAAHCLLARGARVSLCDLRLERAREAVAELVVASEPGAAGEHGAAGEPGAAEPGSETRVRLEEDLEWALRRHRLLFDATPASGFIRGRHIRPDTRIAAPGVPLGLSAGALRAAERRVVHDPLQIGTAVMLVEALLS
jgi:pyrrolysine biosynthesis protein PylD